MAKPEKLSDSDIARYIDILEKTFDGVRPDISGEKLKDFFVSFKNKKYSECILKIKRFLCLPMTLRIGYIREGNVVDKKAKNFWESVKNAFKYFTKSKYPSIGVYRELKKKNPAFTITPGLLPLYSQKEFESITITMYIRSGMLKERLGTFVYAIAHELLHIVLRALDHKLRNSETATDLAVMVLGFSEVVKFGRKGRVWGNQQYTYGYLNDQQFSLAYKIIKRKQNKRPA